MSNNLSEEMRKSAMQVLIKYCKERECKDCIFYYSEEECGIHNPSTWKGTKDE